jgi:hypothetical protein
MVTGFDVAKDQEAKSGDYQCMSAFASDEAATGMVRFKSVVVTIATRLKRNVVDVRSHNPLGLEQVTPSIDRKREQDRHEGREQQHDPPHLLFPPDVGEQIASIMGYWTPAWRLLR